MAAFFHSRAGSRTYNGGSSALAGQELPGGCCNFHDLRPGASVTSCGCKRFWLNVDHYTGQQSSERAWCFCGHHACFHDAFSQQREQEQGMSIERMRDDTNARRTSIEHSALPHGYVPAEQIATAGPKRPTGLGIRPDSRSQSQSQSINARIWDALNGFARQQEDGAFSDIPSTAAPSVVDEPRFSPGYAEQQQGHGQCNMAPPVNIPQSAAARPSVEELSATEVNTPSMTGTPDFRAVHSSSDRMRPSPGHLPPGRFLAEQQGSIPAATAVPASDSSANPTKGGRDIQTGNEPSLLEMQNLIRSWGRRLDLLESLSFSHVPVEELQERFEHFDGRLLDLEQWRGERDREQEQASPEPADRSSNKRRRLHTTDLDSFSSDVSFDSNAAAHTEAVVMATLATNAITDPRIEALENRVTDLENAGPPSFVRPWQVQVVLLPWGRQLHGIWFSSSEATQRSLRAATQEEWSGAQSMPKLSFKSSDSAAWTTESIQAWANEAQDWLSPKACGPTGTVFQRLASRGLVQDITLTAPDSRHILGSLRTAFSSVLGKTEATREHAGPHQALTEEFIPLRKVRKSARLRFLTPSEMTTAATWDATFLDASVFMKVGNTQRRLYLTTPDAYLQFSGDGWTWSSLRQLPLHDATAGEQAAQATGTALEACWSYNEHLDHATSTQSSFASHASQWALHTPDVQDVDTNEVSATSTRSEDQSRHQRTVSLPSSSLAASAARDDLPKRRVASFETAGVMPIYTDDHGLEIQAKRRRISISPEAERRGVNFTPRWSREPPSPFTSEAAMEARSQGASSRNKRGATPFAYATPHSNSQYIGRPEYFGGDGDTEADTDLAAGQSDRGEEEWEGVDDGPGFVTGADEKDDMSGDDDLDEHDLDEGLPHFGT